MEFLQQLPTAWRREEGADVLCRCLAYSGEGGQLRLVGGQQAVESGELRRQAPGGSRPDSGNAEGGQQARERRPAGDADGRCELPGGSVAESRHGGDIFLL